VLADRGLRAEDHRDGTGDALRREGLSGAEPPYGNPRRVSPTRGSSVEENRIQPYLEGQGSAGLVACSPPIRIARSAVFTRVGTFVHRLGKGAETACLREGRWAWQT